VFHAPEQLDEDEFKATASLECKYFEKSLSTVGVDAVQALLLLPFKVHGFFVLQEKRGYSIFCYEPGDLRNPSFWGASSLTVEIADDPI
jgi:hypothetical protein